MRKTPETGSLRPVDFPRITEEIPVLNQLGYAIDTLSFPKAIDSSDADPDFWVQIARAIEEHYSEYDGFVILHGTDTMAYTASALSFMLEDLAKPVVLTGAQLPIGTIRTDGRENIITAIEVAAARSDGFARVPEVSLYFEDYLYRGCRTTKYSASDFEAYRSPNYPALAQAGVRIDFNEKFIHRPGQGGLKVHTRFSRDVACLTLFPGITEGLVRRILTTPGLKGAVVESFGAGNVPTFPWFQSALKEALQEGIVLFNVTSCPSGLVEMSRYEGSAALASLGAVGGDRITREAALTKLMFLIGQGLEGKELRDALTFPLAGEMDIADDKD